MAQSDVSGDVGGAIEPAPGRRLRRQHARARETRDVLGADAEQPSDLGKA